MRTGSWLLAAGAIFFGAEAHAQRGPSNAYPIDAASPAPPLMRFESKDRTTEVEVLVGADGHVVSTELLTRSGNGVYDERVRGFWKGQPFMPALDANGNPVPSTLRARAYYLVRPPSGGAGPAAGFESWRFRTEIPGASADDMASRIGRMTCRDLLWEYDFMHGLAPKAKLQHEEVFQVAFAMFIAARRLGNEARDSLLAQWDTLIGQTLDSCRAQPQAAYWRDAFVHTFASATPVGVNVQ